MQAVAVGWQLYAITGSALDLGLVGLVQFLPMILLTLVVGRFADRYDRRAIVSCCQGLEAGAAALLALGSAGGWLGRESMLGIVALVGAARAFEGPTMAALMPGLVPRLAIPRAAAWAISATQTAQIAGPGGKFSSRRSSPNELPSCPTISSVCWTRRCASTDCSSPEAVRSLFSIWPVRRVSKRP